ncbi:MAG TPA: type II secretion system protein [Baekduia sp.]
MSEHRVIRDEDGFSLVELLMAMAIGSIVLTMLMLVSMRALTSSATAQNRVETAQTARLAMDHVTQLLDAQTCLLVPDTRADHPDDVATQPPIVSGTDNSLTFYADLNGSATWASPDRYTLTYDPTARTLSETRVVGTGSEPRVQYTSTPTSKVLATNIMPARNAANVVQPIFKYYTFPAVNTSTPVQIATADMATKAGTVTRIEVQFQPVPRLSPKEDATHSSSLDGFSNISTADPGTSTVCP